MNRAFVLSILLFVPAVVLSATPRVVQVAPGSSLTAGLQEGVDGLPAEGGIVELAPGDYRLAQPLVLRAHVALVGQGDATRLLRTENEVEVDLVEDAPAGAQRVRVRSTAGFVPGHVVTIHSEESDGWKANHVTLRAIEGNWLVLDRPLAKPCLLAEGAKANNLFPLIYARDTAGLRLERFSMVGAVDERAAFVQEFTNSAVHFVRVNDVVIDRVRVEHWAADGISVQGGENAVVSHCVVEHSVGHGYHPGTDLRSGNWSNNLARWNGQDGFYFCHNVWHLVVQGNRFHDNGRHGIGGLGSGGKDGDRYNVVADNHCWNNARAGIQCSGGADNVVRGNICRNNSREKPGAFPGILVEDTARTLVSGNRCLDDRSGEARTQGWGIFVTGRCADNLITDNLASGNLLGGIGGPAWSAAVPTAH